MHTRSRTWPLNSDPVQRCRDRTGLIDSPDGSTLSLDFTTGVLDPRLTFTRTSNATFINSSGLVQYADANYVQNSNDVTAAGWTVQNGVARSFDNAVVNPEGGFGASLVTASSSIGSSAVNTSSFTVNGGLKYTVSFWVRAGTATQLLVGVYDPSIPPSGAFTPATPAVISGPGTAIGSSSINVSGLTSSWTRIRIYLSPTYSGSRAVSLYPDAAAASGKSVYLWGVKWEAGHVSDPVQITTGASAYYAPRFDFDTTAIGTPRGLLIEGSATNLAFYSEYINPNAAPWNVYWFVAGAGASVTPVSQADPAGGTTASRCVLGTSGSGRVYNGISTTAGVTYTLSFWARSVSGTTSLAFWHFNSATGNSTAVTIGTSWQRYQVTILGRTGGGFVECGIANLTTNAATIDLWGLQFETGFGASSYIPTGASTGNRTADRVSITSGVSAWAGANAANRSYVFDCTIQNFQLGTSDFPDMVTLADGANRDRHYFYNSSGSVRTYITGDYAGTADDWQTNTGGASATVPIRRKIGLAIQPGTVFRSVDGASESSITGSPATFAPTALYIGPMSELTADPGRRGSLLIRSFKYWPSTLPQTTLNAATAL